MLRDIDFGWEAANTLEGVAALTDDLTQAARWLGAAQAERDRKRMHRRLYQNLDYADRVDAIRSALGDKAFETCWNAGYALSQTEGIDAALEVVTSPPEPRIAYR